MKNKNDSNSQTLRKHSIRTRYSLQPEARLASPYTPPRGRSRTSGISPQHMHTHRYAHKYTHSHTLAHTFTQIHTHTQTQIHTHAHTHTHTRSAYAHRCIDRQS